MTLQFTYCDVSAVVADNDNLMPVPKQKAKITQYHEMCEFFKPEVRIYIHEPEAQWENGLTNDSNKHVKDNLVNSSVMIELEEIMEFAITPHLSYSNHNKINLFGTFPLW